MAKKKSKGRNMYSNQAVTDMYNTTYSKKTYPTTSTKTSTQPGPDYSKSILDDTDYIDMSNYNSIVNAKSEEDIFSAVKQSVADGTLTPDPKDPSKMGKMQIRLPKYFNAAPYKFKRNKVPLSEFMKSMGNEEVAKQIMSEALNPNKSSKQKQLIAVLGTAGFLMTQLGTAAIKNANANLIAAESLKDRKKEDN